jgi:predicted  nucleic acid-binding Zn-ribbon protein
MVDLEERKCKRCGRIFTPTLSLKQWVCPSCGLKNLLEFINMKTLVSPTPKNRAWDERNKVMHYDFEYITSGKDGKTDGSDWIVFKSDKQKLSDKPHPFENPFFAQQLKIMQWTGLNDDSGKPIYDGDVMSGVETGDEETKDITVISVVRWCLEDAMWVVQDPFSGEINELADYSLAQTVIGNVWENPGLVHDCGK